MTRQSVWVLLLSSGWAVAGDPLPPDHAAIARRAWAVTELVAAHHVDPPPRADLLRGGVNAMLRAAGRPPAPADLGARLAAVGDAEGLAAALRSVWPAAGPPDSLTYA